MKKLIIHHEWIKNNQSKDNTFMSILDSFTTRDASTLIKSNQIKPTELNRLLTLPPGATPPSSKVKLAIIGVSQADNNPGDRSRTYLEQILNGAREFPASLNLGTSTGGVPSEQAILENIGISDEQHTSGPQRPNSPAAPPDNVDLNGDGENDYYIVPMTRRSHVHTIRSPLNVRRRPGTNQHIIGSINRGENVDIIGSKGNWYAVEYNNRIGFVSQRYIELTPTF